MHLDTIKSVFVYGAGSWGTALASYFSSIKKKTTLFSKNPQIAQDINLKHINPKYLNNIILHPDLKAIDYVPNINNFDLVVLAITSQSFDMVIDSLIDSRIDRNTKFLIATKGFSQNPIKLISDKFRKSLENDFAFISGPNLAYEIAKSKYSSATISSPNLEFAKFLSKELGSSKFIMNFSDNIITVQIASILKNIFAIRSGILSYEENFGENFHASLLVEYLQEIKKLSIACGGKTDSLINYGILGDLIVTNYSTKSRNYKFGYNVRAKDFDVDFIENYPILVEGFNALNLIKNFIPQGIDLPHVNSLMKLFKI
ncbi:MAG: NAD(P)H-dependent glycerol-3-phosphate dehydrogenase [Rickettsia sp.]|nr:NAD(P)H-dependent glycerol-3-phosphate dehydrogenase [Rickettsia sp.]